MLKRFKRCIYLERKYTHVENGASYHITRCGNKLSIYFEWSNGLIDWLHNFYFPAKPYRKMDDLWFCHRGFLKVWKTIESYISKDILNLEITDIEIVGYSHGAAIAQLCYEYVKFNRPDVNVSGVGFGSPRVVWGFVSKPVKRRFDGFVVVRNGKDIVTHLPPAIFGFRHLGKIVKIGTYKSQGLFDDHRDENYFWSLVAWERTRGEKTCARCGAVREDFKPLDWQIREGDILCPKCTSEYDDYVRLKYL